MISNLLESRVESVRGTQGTVVAVATAPDDLYDAALYLWIQCDDGIIRRIPAIGAKVIHLGLRIAEPG